MNYDQVPFDASEFVDNPEPRCPCLLLLDTSASMAGQPIEQLNAGLQTFSSQLLNDSLAAKRVEVAVMSFGPVRLQSDFSTAEYFQAPTLRAEGVTPMGEAIVAGLDLVEQRKQTYREQGVAYYRPWVFLITDGAPTDDWRPAAQRVGFGEERKAFSFFAVGVEGADMGVLGQISTRDPLKLRGLEFNALFSWLSSSMSSVSRSQTHDEVPLINPATPKGWATV